jgi:hypothetical protein
MFGPYRGFPFRGLALIALGFLLASALAGGGSAAAGAAAGLALLIPLLLFKMLAVFFLFGALLRFAGGSGWRRGRRPGWDRGGPWSARGDTFEGGDRSPWGRDDRSSFDRERWEWEESLRQAREELRDYDTPFPPSPGGFEPPKPAEYPED